MNRKEIENIKNDLEKKLSNMSVKEQDMFLNKYGFKYERKSNLSTKKNVRLSEQRNRKKPDELAIAIAVPSES